MIRIKEYEKVALAGGGDVPPLEDPNNRESRKKLDKPDIPDRKALDRFQDKSPEEQRQSLNEQSQVAKDRQKLDRQNTSSNEGAPSKGQRQLERGHETER